MSSYSAYQSHHNQSAGSKYQSRAPTPTSPAYSEQTIFTVDYSNNTNNHKSISYKSSNYNINNDSMGSPTSTLHSAHSPARGSSPTMGFSDTSLAEPTKWKRFRIQVMKMATVERLQLLWGLLALFGSMSWMALMPAYAFSLGRYRLHFPVCDLAVTLSVPSSPESTRSPTSWMVLAADKDFGAETNCLVGPLAKQAGYTAQCRGINVAIVLDVVVFLLWIPISLVIVCGTVERGLWWWGEDDGWAQGEAIARGSNMMSEEEFDMKIGLGGVKQVKRRQTVHPDNLQQSDMVMIQQPKPAFVTPIASQFRSSDALGLGPENDGDEEDFTNFTPSSYRKHHQQRQQQQQRRLNRQPSNNSLSSRLSGFFGAGWGTGQMPPPEEPMPEMPSQYRQENANASRNNLQVNNGGGGEQKPKSSRKKEEAKKEVEQEPEPAGLQHGAEYASQWHSRRYDDWS
ncbi:hypothetical protein BGX26_007441 [Mortierella sp. AD094]|nr:hypothetical protein BGX26_007441 [Mortierella sp. AD094]